MKALTYPVGMALCLFLASCGNSPQADHHAHDSLPPADTAAPHSHGHGHSHANAYMNQSEFQELVQRFEGAEREKWQQPAKVLDALGPLKGKTIADLGAGTGYFSVRMAERGANVIALDIDDRFLHYITQRKDSLPADVASRISPRACTEQASGLQAAEVDGVFSVNTYHHINDRPAYFRALRSCIKPGGWLVIVDFKAGELPVGPPPDHKVALAQMKAELTEAGYTQITVDEQLLEYQFVLRAREK